MIGPIPITRKALLSRLLHPPHPYRCLHPLASAEKVGTKARNQVYTLVLDLGWLPYASMRQSTVPSVPPFPHQYLQSTRSHLPQQPPIRKRSRHRKRRSGAQCNVSMMSCHSHPEQSLPWGKPATTSCPRLASCGGLCTGCAREARAEPPSSLPRRLLGTGSVGILPCRCTSGSVGSSS